MRNFICAAMIIAAAPMAQAATWTYADYTDFPALDATQSGVNMTQGLAWNPATKEWVTSWQYGLGRATSDFQFKQTTGGINTSNGSIINGIPAELAAQGFDHIGDIDVYDGIIYASLDSEAGDYQNGHVALFNASDLSYTGVLRELVGAPSNPNDDVASWVAVDGAAQLGYGKEWKNGNTINIYNLADWSFVDTLTMDQSLRNIQGAKVFDGMLYLSSHNSTKSIYSVDLTSGHVEELFQLPMVGNAFNETEGIALRKLADGSSEMFVEMIVQPNGSDLTNSYVRVFRFTSEAEVAPVPLPAAMPLALAGLGALGLLRRRRKG